MVGNDADANSSPSQNNNTNSVAEYLTLAAQARATGDVVLSLHLYLAAYERSLQDSRIPEANVIEGLRQAWELAVSSKERSLAEYIFEKIEPYLTPDEVGQFAGKLQHLALEKLEEFGLSREDLEDMTDMISQDFFGLDPGSLFMRIDRGISTSDMFGAIQRGLVRGNKDSSESQDSAPIENISFESANLPASQEMMDAVKEFSQKYSAMAAQKRDALVAQDEATAQIKQPHHEKAEQNKDKQNNDGAAEHAAPEQSAPVQAEGKNKIPGDLGALIPAEGMPGLFALPALGAGAQMAAQHTAPKMTYRDLVGYENAIEAMHAYGIGIENDPEYKELVDLLNQQHGLSKIPVSESFLFRSPVREDANQFMLATMGEINLPAIRMRMEENLQGMPVLCVMASADNQPRLNAARNAIEGHGVLILEDIDLWGSPLLESGSEEFGGFVYAQLSRGAREAMNLIRSAVENPEVYVLMSSSSDSDIATFFHELTEPLTVVDIEYPTKSERTDLWANIVSEHPSLKSIDRGALVSYSAHMSRYDIYMAAREAVEDAYKSSLGLKRYVPVAAANVFEKIASFQPLESDEYQNLENAVIESFSNDLDKNIDDLLKGSSE